METAITNAFDQQIRRQLDPIWYRVSLRSKQLLNEIKILRVLLEYLLRYDALGFCKFLETLVMADATASSTGGFRSYWLMMDMAHTLIRVAKERVYKVSDKDGSLEAQIERISKWKALEGVLTNSDGKKILIMVHQEHTRRTLTKIISLGYDKWQESKFKEYCQWKRIARDQSGLASGVSVVVDATGPPPPLRRRSKPQRTLIPEKLPEDEEDESIPTLEEDEPVCNLPENLLLCCYSDNDDYHDFVSRIRPDVVIMYETDLAFIRALELYSHYNPEIELNVTLLVYAESVEEQLQLLAIRQEKEAFENLIKIKSVYTIIN